MRAAGNAAAVSWFTGAGNTPKTFVAFSADAGKTFGAPVRIDTSTNVTLGRLAMLMPSADRVLVTSLERGSTGARLLMREVRRNGALSEPLLISDATPDRSGGFARVARSGRRVVIAWTDVRPGTPTRISLASLELR